MPVSTRRRIKDLEPEDLAILSYFSDEKTKGTFDVLQFQACYPFSTYLFSPQELESRLQQLAEQGFLSAEIQGERTVYSPGTRLDRTAVVEAGHVSPLIQQSDVAIMQKIPFSAFTQLATVSYDPCLEAFKRSLRVADNPKWWDTLCDLSRMFMDAASPGQPISKLIAVLSHQMGQQIAWENKSGQDEIDELWRQQAKVSVMFTVDQVTPWKDIHLRVFFVRAAELDITARDQIEREALDALLEDATLESLIMPVGEMGQTAADTLLSVKGVVLGLKDVKQIAIAGRPREKFREVLRQRLDIRLLSPYQTHGSVPESMFYGRKQELRIILSHPETNFAIYGGRKSGKSSLLKQLQRVWKGKRPVVFVDCELGIESEPAFCKAICAELGVTAVERLDLLCSPSVVTPPCSVILVDEIDPLLKKEDPLRFLAALRKLHAERDIQCILAGWERLHEISKDIRGPMFNLADAICLGPFTENEALDLARSPMVNLGVKFEDGDSTVKQLINYAGRFPYLIQVMCSGLIERLSETKGRRVTRVLLEDVFWKEIRKEIQDLFNYTLNSVQKLIVCSALLVKQMPLRAIVDRVQRDYPTLTLESIQEALDLLVVLFLLKDDTMGGYEWAYDRFPEVLKRSIDPELAIAQAKKEIEREGR